MGIPDPSPPTLAEGDVVDGVLVVEAFVEVDELVDVEFANLAQARASLTAAFGMIEAQRLGIAHKGLPHPAEEQAQQRGHIGVGGHGGARVGGGLALVDHDGHRQTLDGIHVRTAILGQILLHKGGKGVGQLATRLGGDGIEHQRALARTRHAGEHSDLVLGNGERHLLQVVLARPAHDDMVKGMHDEDGKAC